MNFIEQIFGITVDEGNGLLELSLLVLVFVVVVTVPLIRRTKRSLLVPIRLRASQAGVIESSAR
jgi:hypothetical protein